MSNVNHWFQGIELCCFYITIVWQQAVSICVDQLSDLQQSTITVTNHLLSVQRPPYLQWKAFPQRVSLLCCSVVAD